MYHLFPKQRKMIRIIRIDMKIAYLKALRFFISIPSEAKSFIQYVRKYK